jgi:hypothetical protein
MFLALVLAAVLARPAPATDPEPLLATVTVGGICDGSCRGGTLVIGAGEIVGRRPNGALLVLTARHVVENIAQPRVYLREDTAPGASFASIWSRTRGRIAHVIAVASDADLALVSFRPQYDDAYAVATLADDGRPAGGDVIGDPNGALWTTSPFAFIESANDTYVVDCATCGPGDSGGGVFDDRGRLAGILVKQRIDPAKIVDGEPAGTTQFQVVALAKVRSFLALGRTNTWGNRLAQTEAWSRFDAMRR